MRSGEPRIGLPQRPLEGRLIAGVCAGFAERYLVDVTLVRLAFILLALAWGLGLLLYGLLWLLTLEQRGSADGWRDFARGNLGQLRQELSASGRRLSSAWSQLGRRPWPRPLDRRWIAIGAVAAGLLLLLGSFGAFAWLTPMRAVALAVICAGAAVLLTLGRG